MTLGAIKQGSLVSDGAIPAPDQFGGSKADMPGYNCSAQCTTSPSSVRNMYFEGSQNMSQMGSPFMEKEEVCLSLLQKELKTIV